MTGGKNYTNFSRERYAQPKPGSCRFMLIRVQRLFDLEGKKLREKCCSCCAAGQESSILFYGTWKRTPKHSIRFCSMGASPLKLVDLGKMPVSDRIIRLMWLSHQRRSPAPSEVLLCFSWLWLGLLLLGVATHIVHVQPIFYFFVFFAH